MRRTARAARGPRGYRRGHVAGTPAVKAAMPAIRTVACPTCGAAMLTLVEPDRYCFVSAAGGAVVRGRLVNLRCARCGYVWVAPEDRPAS
jgi:hypothetical protein